MLGNIRIVLVSPGGPTNIGAVARIMRNMGLSDLVFVAPRCDPRAAQARAYATHATELLANARVVPNISAGLAGCIRAYATSGKLGLYRRQAAIAPHQAAAEAIALARTGPVAIAFGRESHGLFLEELLQFDRVVAIPADPGYPVLNLAAAVTVLCYELRRAWAAAEQQPDLPQALHSGWPPAERKEVFFQHLFTALDQIGFLFGPNPDHLKYSLRHLFGRVDLSVNELDILIGLARQIQWYAAHYPRRPEPPPPRTPQRRTDREEHAEENG